MFEFRFSAFLRGETQIIADEAFTKAIQSYTEVIEREQWMINVSISFVCRCFFDRNVCRKWYRLEDSHSTILERSAMITIKGRGKSG